MSTIELRKEVASQQYALDNCQDDMNQLGKVKEAWENGFDTALSRDILIKGQSLDDWEKLLLSRWIVMDTHTHISL